VWGSDASKTAKIILFLLRYLQVYCDLKLFDFSQRPYNCQPATINVGIQFNYTSSKLEMRELSDVHTLAKYDADSSSTTSKITGDF
jgi:hypothetical protein